MGKRTNMNRFNNQLLDLCFAPPSSFLPSANCLEEGHLGLKELVGWRYSWGDLAVNRVGVASDAAGHFETEVEEAIPEGCWERK